MSPASRKASGVFPPAASTMRKLTVRFGPDTGITTIDSTSTSFIDSPASARTVKRLARPNGEISIFLKTALTRCTKRGA
jgi:hypothetical protein